MSSRPASLEILSKTDEIGQWGWGWKGQWLDFLGKCHVSEANLPCSDAILAGLIWFGSCPTGQCLM